jgi:ketosteroid isomerase-like protein
MLKSEVKENSDNENRINTSNIKLNEEMQDACNSSPVEVVLYYIYNPTLLMEEANKLKVSAHDLLLNAWQNAIEYWHKKKYN